MVVFNGVHKHTLSREAVCSVRIEQNEYGECHQHNYYVAEEYTYCELKSFNQRCVPTYNDHFHWSFLSNHFRSYFCPPNLANELEKCVRPPTRQSFYGQWGKMSRLVLVNLFVDVPWTQLLRDIVEAIWSHTRPTQWLVCGSRRKKQVLNLRQTSLLQILQRRRDEEVVVNRFGFRPAKAKSIHNDCKRLHLFRLRYMHTYRYIIHPCIEEKVRVPGPKHVEITKRFLYIYIT